MSFFKNILSAVLIFGVFSNIFSQSTYCPEKMLLLQKYKSKAYENARGYIDTVLSQCPDQNQDPYFWHVCGFINKDIFEFIENKEPGSVSMANATNCFIKSLNLDVEKKYFDLNNKLLDYFSTFYYNDAVKILQKFDVKNQDNAIAYYNSFKKLKRIAHPDYDFRNKEVDFYFGIGMLYKMRYEKDKANSKSLLDSCINYFNKSLAIDPHQYSSNYNLGILYHNLGVDIIMEELDIDQI